MREGLMLDSQCRDILFSAVAPPAHLVDISHDSNCQPSPPLSQWNYYISQVFLALQLCRYRDIYFSV